jgi:hypothetical protein
MSLYAELNKNPSRRDRLSFGLTVAAGMAAIGAYTYLARQEEESARVFFAVGVAVLLLSLVPPIGRILYILWMGFGLTLGWFTTPILMFVVYALVIMPVGLWFKMTRRDVMRRKLDPRAPSYWEDYPGSADPASYIRQY